MVAESKDNIKLKRTGEQVFTDFPGVFCWQSNSGTG